MFPTLIGMVFLSSSPDLGKADVWADDPGRMWSTRNLHNIIILLNTNFNFLICKHFCLHGHCGRIKGTFTA